MMYNVFYYLLALASLILVSEKEEPILVNYRHQEKETDVGKI